MLVTRRAAPPQASPPCSRHRLVAPSPASPTRMRTRSTRPTPPAPSSPCWGRRRGRRPRDRTRGPIQDRIPACTRARPWPPIRRRDRADGWRPSGPRARGAHPGGRRWCAPDAAAVDRRLRGGRSRGCGRRRRRLRVRCGRARHRRSQPGHQRDHAAAAGRLRIGSPERHATRPRGAHPRGFPERDAVRGGLRRHSHHRQGTSRPSARWLALCLRLR